jgi:NAD(P)-dependent dehydrogenase (short-subunit alcohol dehydrogenase family)
MPPPILLISHRGRIMIQPRRTFHDPAQAIPVKNKIQQHQPHRRPSMNRLKGKRALITGGTTGIGLETARRFMAEGARVIITGTNPATLEAARAELGPEALVLSSNAANTSEQKSLAEAVQRHFGQLDILFINAGIVQLQPVEQWTEEAFDRSFAVNVKGPFFLIQALLPVFASKASIVLNGSVNAHIGMPNTSVYAATKASLISFVRTLSGELIARGIRVNAVSPGPISTPLYSKLGLSETDLKQVAASIQGQVPAGRFGTPTEVADAILFFASDESNFSVGSELLLDGGMSAI